MTDEPQGLSMEILEKKFIPMLNDICILYDTDLVRFVGIGEDEMDFYYIVRGLSTMPRQYWASCVGHIYSLNGLVPKERYMYMSELFTLNGSPPVDKMLIINER